MTVPDYVQFCINRLESAGFATYAVGGCVRDNRKQYKVYLYYPIQ